MGHGRGAALGDAVATLLEWTGHQAVREFYINDAGVQIDKLAQSLWARVQQAAGRTAELPEGGYHGEYLADLAATVLQREGPAFADLPEAEGVARARELALRAMRWFRRRPDSQVAEFQAALDAAFDSPEAFGAFHAEIMERT